MWSFSSKVCLCPFKNGSCFGGNDQPFLLCGTLFLFHTEDEDHEVLFRMGPTGLDGFCAIHLPVGSPSMFSKRPPVLRSKWLWFSKPFWDPILGQVGEFTTHFSGD